MTDYPKMMESGGHNDLLEEKLRENLVLVLFWNPTYIIFHLQVHFLY